MRPLMGSWQGHERLRGHHHIPRLSSSVSQAAHFSETLGGSGPCSSWKAPTLAVAATETNRVVRVDGKPAWPACAVLHSAAGSGLSNIRPRGNVRLITRNDASLVIGLIAGTVVIFQRPLRFIWEAAVDVQERYHVDLLPALTIFAGVFIFHEARKRQQARADARTAAAEAAQARIRSAELERLMAFSQALANALDPTLLEQALWRYLPSFAGEREFWVLARRPDGWETLLQDTTA